METSHHLREMTMGFRKLKVMITLTIFQLQLNVMPLQFPIGFAANYQRTQQCLGSDCIP